MVNVIKLLNELNNDDKHILRLIQNLGPITKNKLIDITKKKLSTLNRSINRLENASIISALGTADSTGGRKPVLYDMVKSNYYIFGIDISRTYTRAVLTDIKMNIIDRYYFTMDESCIPAKTVALIAQYIENTLKLKNIDKKQVLGTGIGTVGPLEKSKGIVLNPMNFTAKGWTDVPLKKMLQAATGIPVFVDNGANTAILAEWLFGAGRDCSNMAYFNCGIGIRTGAISSGTLVRTINDAEDAFGHMTIDVDGEKCHCGNYGCIESYCSVISITGKFTSSLKKGRTSSISKALEDISYVDVCRAAEERDPLSAEIIKSSAAVFGSGLANYVNLFNPEIVILSGPLIKYSALFSKISTEIAINKSFLKDNTKVIFSKGGKFTEDAISLGSAVMVSESHLNA